MLVEYSMIKKLGSLPLKVGVISTRESRCRVCALKTDQAFHVHEDN